jgi:glycosyltransferase involved in cell wall biosynthesis
MGIVDGSSKVNPEVSVIVPLHRDGNIFRTCINRLVTLPTKKNYEVLVVSDQPIETALPEKVIAITTDLIDDSSPAVKRDSAVKHARASILAFIDDDAYPASDWLDRALEHFADENVNVIGGPGLTPPSSSALERVGGAVYESRFGSGPLRHRFIAVGEAHQVDDIPAYNFLVRASALEKAGGWASDFYGGEDTKVCLALQEKGYSLMHYPDMRVYHFRRRIIGPHFRQIGNVGRHRGYFVRRYPGNSRKVVYFLPAVAILSAIVATIVGLAVIPKVTIATVAAAWLVMSATCIKRVGILPSLAFPFALVMHHFSYSMNFLRGLFGRDLHR